MRLEDPEGHLELDVVGYQFDPATGDRFDDNWLVVAGAVTSGDLHWRFRDPCLLVSEARAIGHWLRHTATPDARPSRLDFTEPCIAWDVVERSEAHVIVRVELGWEAAPADSDAAGVDPFALDLRLSAGQLVAAGDAWLADVARFPPR